MKRMKRRVCMSAALLAIMLVVVLASGVSAGAAADYETLTVELPYKHVYTTNDTSVDSLFHYIIEVVDGNGSLPAEADEDGAFTCEGKNGTGTADGDGTVYDLSGTLSFTFTKPGEYAYLVKADAATDSQKANAERYTFETREYTLRFYIGNATDGSLRLRMLTAEDGEEKPNEIELNTKYQGPTPTPPPSPSPTPSPSPMPNVKTGDEAPVGRYMLLMLGSALLTGLLAVHTRREKAKK